MRGNLNEAHKKRSFLPLTVKRGQDYLEKSCDVK